MVLETTDFGRFAARRGAFSTWIFSVVAGALGFMPLISLRRWGMARRGGFPLRSRRGVNRPISTPSAPRSPRTPRRASRADNQQRSGAIGRRAWRALGVLGDLGGLRVSLQLT